LHAFAWWCRGSGQCLSPPTYATGNFRLPVGQIIGNLERDRHELYATELTDGGSKAGRPTSGLATEDRLQCLPLPLVRSFIDEKTQLGFGASPEVPFKTAKRQQIKAVELNVAKVALSNMPDEHALTAIVGRRLGKFTGARDVAAADVEPVTREPPFWNGVHTVSPA
jgi:hypothetical protein